MQPDTIIPDLSNPQTWNRYAYAGNNPIGYTDPSGHSRVEGCIELAGGCNVTQQTIDDDLKKDEEFRQRTEYNKCKAGNRNYCSGWDNAKEDLKNAWDWFVWRTVPSAVGIDFGIQGQYGLLAEVELTPVEIQILYNWRSKQLSVFKSSGTGGYLGSPNVLGFTGYLGIMTVKGASDNRYVAGKSLSLGATAQIDAIGKAGISKVIGASWDTKTKMPFVDPVSKVPVSFQQTNIIGGANIFPDAFDVGIFAGESDSQMISPP